MSGPVVFINKIVQNQGITDGIKLIAFITRKYSDNMLSLNNATFFSNSRIEYPLLKQDGNIWI